MGRRSVDGDRVQAGRVALVLSRTATTAASVVLAGVHVPAAHGDGGQAGGICEGTALTITVCASGSGAAPGAAGGTARPAVTSGGPSTPSCTYTRLNPQPPAENLFWKGHDRSEKGEVYGVNCPGQQGARTVWIADGQAPDTAPVIDPETVARKAAASMRLEGPKVASPRAAGTYVIGMPMWMWVTPSASTFGPVSASATAGSVTATAKVARVRWVMGDGATVTCHGPGTPYRKSREVTESPDCGHLYERPSYLAAACSFRTSRTTPPGPSA
ncbi:ATP/GTP-binding protein [Streptomyces sp. NPDC058637]|uniref:ATP/GTP-binding protein n=1 Tax=Streptomyces sp. NPDC058637 TaxID=3346569 RepID=UPI00366702A2